MGIGPTAPPSPGKPTSASAGLLPEIPTFVPETPEKPAPAQKKASKNIASGNIKDAKADIKKIENLLAKDMVLHRPERRFEKLRRPGVAPSPEEKRLQRKIRESDTDLKLHGTLQEKKDDLRAKVKQELLARLKRHKDVTKADVREIGDEIITDLGLKVEPGIKKDDCEVCRFTAIVAIDEVERELDTPIEPRQVTRDPDPTNLPLPTKK